MRVWRRPRAVHDPGKVQLDVALTVALGGNCLADVAMPRAQPAVFGPVASDPTVSRLIDTRAAAGPTALHSIRAALAEVREHVRDLAKNAARDATGCVIVDLDGVTVWELRRLRLRLFSAATLVRDVEVGGGDDPGRSDRACRLQHDQPRPEDLPARHLP